ncbi:MAG: hypothetical protein ACOYON_16110 [Fimbriimonas sp.]
MQDPRQEQKGPTQDQKAHDDILRRAAHGEIWPKAPKDKAAREKGRDAVKAKFRL